VVYCNTKHSEESSKIERGQWQCLNGTTAQDLGSAAEVRTALVVLQEEAHAVVVQAVIFTERGLNCKGQAIRIAIILDVVCPCPGSNAVGRLQWRIAAIQSKCPSLSKTVDLINETTAICQWRAVRVAQIAPRLWT